MYLYFPRAKIRAAAATLRENPGAGRGDPAVACCRWHAQLIAVGRPWVAAAGTAGPAGAHQWRMGSRWRESPCGRRFSSGRDKARAAKRGDRREIWEKLGAIVEFEKEAMRRARLIPLDLGFGQPLPMRGRPLVASAALGQSIIDLVKTKSEQYGTEIVYVPDDNIGLIVNEGLRPRLRTEIKNTVGAYGPQVPPPWVRSATRRTRSLVAAT